MNTMLGEPGYTAGGLVLPPVTQLLQDKRFLHRFWSKVQKPAGRRLRKSTCWEWTAHREEKGYGQFRCGGRVVAAHRVAFALANRRWPSSSLMILHSCDNPCCVNPHHLREGSAQDNQDDIKARNRRKHPGVEHWRHGRPSEAILRGGSNLSEDDVRRIRSEAKDEGDALLLALEYECTATTIAQVANGKRFAWVYGGSE